MTTRNAAFRSRAQLIACLMLAAGFLAPSEPARADDTFALECDVVAGIRSVRLSGPKRTEVIGYALDRTTWVYEVHDPSLMGLRPGATSCVAARSVRVLPGYLLGTRTSRIVVTHDGETPRSFSKGGRHRLTWLPDAPPVAQQMRPAPPPAVEPEPAREPMREILQADEESRRLAAQLEAQREENARLRARLAGEAEPEAAAQPPARRVEPMPPAMSKRERKQQAKAERRAELQARRDDRQARRDAKRARKQGGPATPPPASSPPTPAATPAAAPSEPYREPEPMRQPERHRVVVGAPEQPAATPRGLPPDYVAFPSVSNLVVTIPTDLKDGPGRRYRTLRRMAPSERVRVTGRAGDWYRVGDGEGWAFATYLESESQVAGASDSYLGVVQEVTVPVHEGPGGQHAVVAELYRGQQVVLDELKGDWAHVRNGGWVRRDALGGLKPGPGR